MPVAPVWGCAAGVGVGDAGRQSLMHLAVSAEGTAVIAGTFPIGLLGELVSIGTKETHLGEDRLRSELRRTTFQPAVSTSTISLDALHAT